MEWGLGCILSHFFSFVTTFFAWEWSFFAVLEALVGKRYEKNAIFGVEKNKKAAFERKKRLFFIAYYIYFIAKFV